MCALIRLELWLKLLPQPGTYRVFLQCGSSCVLLEHSCGWSLFHTQGIPMASYRSVIRDAELGESWYWKPSHRQDTWKVSLLCEFSWMIRWEGIAEAIPTLVTQEGLLPCVCSQMLNRVGTVRKAFPTFKTCIWFFSQVCSLVCPQVRIIAEHFFFLAFRTIVGLLSKGWMDRGVDMFSWTPSSMVRFPLLFL